MRFVGELVVEGVKIITVGYTVTWYWKQSSVSLSQPTIAMLVLRSFWKAVERSMEKAGWHHTRQPTLIKMPVGCCNIMKEDLAPNTPYKDVRTSIVVIMYTQWCACTYS